MYLCEVSNRAIFDQFFADLGHLKIDNVVNAFAEDGYYHDMPVATDPTVGRDAIRKKLTFLTAAQQLDFNFSLVTEVGNSILAERVEVWHFASGETPTLPVMCVMDFRDGQVAGWREYWDMQTLMSQMPASFFEAAAALG
jgi:limonene-1,2-epoxide hydrolase